MDYDMLIDSLVKEVLKRLENVNKSALVIFTGGSIGFHQAVNQLKLLKDNGWRLKVFLSESAEKVLTAGLVSRLLKLEEIFIESNLTDEKALLKDIKTVIIPVLTMNSAAKIALGIADTAATHIAASAIMKGIPIIACQNACSPRDKERLAGNFSKIPEAYERKINSYLEDLKAYGIRLVEADNLYEEAARLSTASAYKIRESIAGSSVKSPVQARVSASTLEEKQTPFIDKKLITREDITVAKNSGLKEIVVSKNTIITALAKDSGRELGVGIRCI